MGPVSLDLLGSALRNAGDDKAAEAALREARRWHPDDVWLNYDVAALQERKEEKIRYYSIARACRPETAHELAHVLEKKGEWVEAIAVFRDLVRLRPVDGHHWACYGGLLKQWGDRSGSGHAAENAVAILRRRIQLTPDDIDARYLLGNALHDLGKPGEAIAAYREAIRLRPELAEAHCNLGTALRDQGKLDEAIDEYRDAIRFRPELAEAHCCLGVALRDQGKTEQAIAEYREAIRVKPDDAKAHVHLGRCLNDQGKLDEAIAEYREAIRLKPDDAAVHFYLGNALITRAKADEAVAAYRLAVGLSPTTPRPTATSVRA